MSYDEEIKWICKPSFSCQNNEWLILENIFLVTNEKNIKAYSNSILFDSEYPAIQISCGEKYCLLWGPDNDLMILEKIIEIYENANAKNERLKKKIQYWAENEARK